MEVIGYWLVVIALDAGLIAFLAWLFPDAVDALRDLWGEPEWRR